VGGGLPFFFGKNQSQGIIVVLKRLTEPQEPDTLARIAGKDIYGTTVGALRRVELWRLGNAWGMNFPVGATKDFMLPFFMRLEAEGKNPMRPPGMVIEHTGQLRSRDVVFSEQNHTENSEESEEEVPPVVPSPSSEFEAMLLSSQMWRLRKLCKMRGIKHSPKDCKADLVNRIMATIGDQNIEQDTPGRDQRPFG